jgi:WD40 repeat protein
VVALFGAAASSALAFSEVPGSPFASDPDSLPISVAFSSDGGLIATGNNATSNVSVFSVNQVTGALSEVTGSPFPSGAVAFGVAFSPTAPLLAVSNNPGRNVFEVDQATGALTQVPGSPFPVRLQSSVAFSPNGHLLATSAFANAVSVFNVNPTTGALTEVEGSPFATGTETELRSVAFSPNGKLLATADGTDHAVSVFSVNESTGALNEVSGSPFPTNGQRAVSVAFRPTGGLLATANEICDTCIEKVGTVSVFQVNETTGALTNRENTPIAAYGTGTWTEPLSVAFSPSGELLATSGILENPPANNNTEGVVTVFSVNAVTGALAEIAFLPDTAAGSSSAAFSPTGALLATAGEATSTVSVFSMAPGPGVVTGGASSTTQTSTELEATVNPNRDEVTACTLEYGLTIPYGKSVPCSGSPGSGFTPVLESAAVTGLLPNTVYHFRITATNASGTAYGADQTFKTLPAPAITKLKPTKGPVSGGTSVVISGTNLAGASAVRFGTVDATSFTTNVVKGVLSIKAISPAEAAGTVDVRVTTGGSTSAAVTKDHFKFVPTVTGVSPNNGSKAGARA